MRRFLLAAILLAACSSSSNQAPPADDGSPQGQSGGESMHDREGGALADEATMAELFGAARTVLYGEPARSSTASSALPGRRVFVCAYQDDPRRQCGTGVGSNLHESATAAAQELSARLGDVVGAARKDGIRLKIDVVTKVSDRSFKQPVEKPKKREVATYGMWVDVDGERSYVLPSEILEEALFNPQRKVRGIERKRIVKHLRARNKSLGDLPEEFDYTRLHTVAWLERDEPGQHPPGVFQLYRIHARQFDELTPDLLTQRIVWAADYLVSSITPDGKIRYEYRTAQDRDSRSYNLLRHGGTTYSVLQAYDRTRHEPYRLASEQALTYLFKECDRDVRTGPKGPVGKDAGESMYIVSPGGKVKLGGAGLALVAIDQYVEATGNTEKYKEEALGFARFLVASMKDDGEFIYFPSRKPGGKPTSTDGSAYYPGEAILGLTRMYSWDPNPLWLQTAVDGADWLIDVRDAGKEPRRMANDHWLMLALGHLYHYTGDTKYLDHTLKIAKAVEYQYEKNRPAWEKYPDFQGGYYDPPRSTPAATRGEGLGAVLDACLVAKRTDCDWVKFLLEETVRHENLSQYDPDTTYWMRDKAKTFGGWNGGLLDVNVRNDFVQHNMSSLLGLERYLRYDLGETLPGGPGYTEKSLAGEVTWSGIPKDELAKLRAATLRFRGESYWDKKAAEEAAAAEPTPAAE